MVQTPHMYTVVVFHVLPIFNSSGNYVVVSFFFLCHVVKDNNF